MKLHEYYAIIGRPRFGRSDIQSGGEGSEKNIMGRHYSQLLFNRIDKSGDASISKHELEEFLSSLVL